MNHAPANCHWNGIALKAKQFFTPKNSRDEDVSDLKNESTPLLRLLNCSACTRVVEPNHVTRLKGADFVERHQSAAQPDDNNAVFGGVGRESLLQKSHNIPRRALLERNSAGLRDAADHLNGRRLNGNGNHIAIHHHQIVCAARFLQALLQVDKHVTFRLQILCGQNARAWKPNPATSNLSRVLELAAEEVALSPASGQSRDADGQVALGRAIDGFQIVPYRPAPCPLVFRLFSPSIKWLISRAYCFCVPVSSSSALRLNSLPGGYASPVKPPASLITSLRRMERVCKITGPGRSTAPYTRTTRGFSSYSPRAFKITMSPGMKDRIVAALAGPRESKVTTSGFHARLGVGMGDFNALAGFGKRAA